MAGPPKIRVDLSIQAQKSVLKGRYLLRVSSRSDAGMPPEPSEACQGLLQNSSSYQNSALSSQLVPSLPMNSSVPFICAKEEGGSEGAQESSLATMI